VFCTFSATINEINTFVVNLHSELLVDEEALVILRGYQLTSTLISCGEKAILIASVPKNLLSFFDN
jgi:hypothetical protein